jgi:diaminopimelate decarboxylase
MRSEMNGRLTCYLSGVHSGPNPSPSLSVALSLRQAFPEARLVAVDYSVESSGLHSDVFDDVWLQRPWRELQLPVYQAAIQQVLDGGALWFAGQDLEVTWLSGALANPSRAMLPPSEALRQVAKPAIHAASTLPFIVPDFISMERSDWELHGFCREHGWRVWVKGPNYEAVRVRDWPSFLAARQLLAKGWSTEEVFVQRHVLGNEETIAFCAFQGELLDCVHMRKQTVTAEGKTWAGRISEVEAAIAEPLREVLAQLEWTGGGELEFVRAGDGTLHMIDWNPRFPAWIHGATLAGHNLPARLVEAAGYGTAAPTPVRASQFTRVVLEIPVRAAYPLPAIKVAHDEWQTGSKHPSGMPDLARRLGEARSNGAGPRRPKQRLRRPRPLPAELQRDLEETVPVGLPTPRRVLLPRAASERFARIEEAAASFSLDLDIGFGYSIKTNPHPSLVALAEQSGMLAEVISRAELQRALSAGFPPERIILNGPGQEWPVGPAPEGALMAAFADSPQSLARWLCEGPPEAGYLGIRLRPITVGSRFGADLGKPKRFAEILTLLRSVPAEREVGIHFHFASDVIGPARWHEVFQSVLHWAEAIQEGIGRPVRCLDTGGGWFPDDFDRELLPRLEELAGAAVERLPRLAHFFVEPGKAIAQPTMALVTTVLEVRRNGDDVTEAVVDAAISDLPMAPFYPHRVYVRSADGRWEALGGRGDRLLGRICMETDILASSLALPDTLRAGDQLVIGDAGGYDASMSYNFGRGVLNDACC